MLSTGGGGSRVDGWNGQWSGVEAKCLEIQVLSPSLWSALSLALQIVPLIAIITFASCLHLNLSSLQGALPQPPPFPDRAGLSHSASWGGLWARAHANGSHEGTLLDKL